MKGLSGTNTSAYVVSALVMKRPNKLECMSLATLYPRGSVWKGLYSGKLFLVLISNIRLGWKDYTGTLNLAYLDFLSLTMGPNKLESISLTNYCPRVVRPKCALFGQALVLQILD
jgi:hypothetical protein